MDTILIRQLKVKTIIGVYPVERQFQQTLLLDLDFATDAARVAETDTMKDALDYAALSEFIQAFGRDHSFYVLETFAQRLSEALAQHFSIHDQIITVYKPGVVLDAQTVGIRIQRGNMHGRY